MANITQNALKEELAKHNVKLLGGGLDEAPFAYKDIELVIQSQKALVDVVGKFTPKIVKMCGAETNRIRKKPLPPNLDKPEPKRIKNSKLNFLFFL